MSVIEAVLAFDGRHVDDLRTALGEYRARDGESLIELCSSGEPMNRVGASWMVKALLERGLEASLDLRAYFSRLDVEREPDVLLHILQSVRFAPDAAMDHRAAVGKLLDHEKVLVGVWAMDALVRIALKGGEGLEEARRHVEEGLVHRKASVRARARHLAPLLGL